jgi:hypothetical protein
MKDYLTLGLVGFIAYIVWQEYQLQQQEYTLASSNAATPPLPPTYVSPSGVCN